MDTVFQALKDKITDVSTGFGGIVAVVATLAIVVLVCIGILMPGDTTRARTMKNLAMVIVLVFIVVCIPFIIPWVQAI